jgi:hypothetical protein
MRFKKWGVVFLMVIALVFSACEESDDSGSDSTEVGMGTVSGELSFVDGSGNGIEGTLKYSVYLLTTEKFSEWNNNGDPSSYASYRNEDVDFISTASVYKTEYSIADVEAGSYHVLAMAWDATDTSGEPDLYGDTSSTGAITVAADLTTTANLSVVQMSGSGGGSGDTYTVTFSVDGTTMTLVNGITSGGQGGYPSASYNTTYSETTIYAYKEDTPFSSAMTPGNVGIIIKDIALNAAGTVTNASIVYFNEIGTMFTAGNVEVTISEYGAENAKIKGTFKGTTVSTGSTTKTIGDGTFTVINTGNE